MKTNTRPILLVSAALTLTGTIAVSQVQPMQPVQWDNRRLDQLDRNVRRLERALTQRNSQGQPVLVEPDPEVVALTGRVGQMDRRLADIEQTFQRVNADNERLTFALDETASENAALRDRVEGLEERLTGFETASRQQAQAAAQAEAEAEQTRSPTGSAAADLAAARTLTADPARGAEALDAVVANWPDTPQAREASWRLGDLRRSGGDMAGAVQAYATALSGWPRDVWAGEVTLKLARGLAATNRRPQACAALGEFERRYSTSASADLRAVAARVQGEAECEA